MAASLPANSDSELEDEEEDEEVEDEEEEEEEEEEKDEDSEDDRGEKGKHRNESGRKRKFAEVKPVDEGSVSEEKEKLEQEFNHMQKKLLALTETPANIEEVPHPPTPLTLVTLILST